MKGAGVWHMHVGSWLLMILMLVVVVVIIIIITILNATTFSSL